MARKVKSADLCFKLVIDSHMDSFTFISIRKANSYPGISAGKQQFSIDTSKASKDIGSISRRASLLRNYFLIN